MAIPKDNIKGPDLSRNTKLAGKTVYSRGWNVEYDKDGYAVSCTKADYTNDDGVNVSPKAQPIEELLAELGE